MRGGGKWKQDAKVTTAEVDSEGQQDRLNGGLFLREKRQWISHYLFSLFAIFNENKSHVSHKKTECYSNVYNET